MAALNVSLNVKTLLRNYMRLHILPCARAASPSLSGIVLPISVQYHYVTCLFMN